MRNIATWFCVLMLLMACSKKGSIQDPTPALSVPDPAKSALISPAQNSLCTTGSVISGTQTSIVFTWTKPANTDSYELDIKNLLTGAISPQIVSTNQFTATLLRNTPYSWYVISKSNNSNVTATSDTWKFYVAGSGTASYSPFPAAIQTPTFGQIITAGTTNVNLTWAGNDVDGDIVGYDVYFSTTITPALLKSNVTDQFLNNVSVTANTTYYWKVITKDSQGNTSDSGIYQFKVN